MYLAHEVLVMTIKLLPLLLQTYQAKMVPLFLASFCSQRRENCVEALLGTRSFWKFCSTLFLLVVGWLVLVPAGAQFYFFRLHVACFYVCFSLHSYSISCHCPPCWPPLWSIQLLKQVLHCKLCITARKFHISVVVHPSLPWAQRKGRQSMGEATRVKPLLNSSTVG